MKKMLTVNKLAASNLRARKKQYTFMIIGIILSMVFSSGVLFFASCIGSSTEMVQKKDFGVQDAIMFNSDADLMKTAKEEQLVGDYGFAHILGFAYTDKNGEDNGTSIAYLDDTAKELSYISFIEGSYPENDNEIAIEKAALARLGIDAQIGDTITLKVLNQNGSELMSQPVEKSYKLTGIVDNKRSNIMNSYSYEKEAIPAAFVKEASQTDAGGKEKLLCYFTFNNKTDDFYGRFNSFLKSQNVDTSSWSLSGYKNAGLGIYANSIYENMGFAIVFATVLLIASGMGIVNAFSSNLDDRKKQIGMLRTVGATKRQIIIIFGREAFIISLICAPVSVAVSYLIVKGIISLMGDEFVFIPNWGLLIACAVFGIACVMLAALIPLSKAAKISPVQSIRNIELTRKMKSKRIKTQKQFNTSSLIAKRNLRFSKTNQVIVSFFLIVSIVFSCYGFSFMAVAKNDSVSLAYDYRLNIDSFSSFSEFSNYVNIEDEQSGFTENDKQTVLSIPYVDRVNAYKSYLAMIKTDTFSDYMNSFLYANFEVYENDVFNFINQATPENIDTLMTAGYKDSYLQIKEKANIGSNYFPSVINAYDSSVIEKIDGSVVDGRIDIEKLNSGEEIILYAPDNVAFRMEEDDYNGVDCIFDCNDKIKPDVKYLKKASRDIKAGDQFNISVITADSVADDGSLVGLKTVEKTVTVGAVVSELPDIFYNEGYNGGTNISMITSLSGMNSVYPNLKYTVLNVGITGECDAEIDKEMQEYLSAITGSVYNASMSSNYELAQNQKEYINTLFLSMISIVILFLSISASIVNNSLTAKIRESKREIGTLRAVGASQRDISNIYIRQLVSILGWSYILGFAVFFISYGIVVLVYKSRGLYLYLELSVWQTIVACVALFGLCALNLWSKIKAEMKNSIIENIREL